MIFFFRHLLKRPVAASAFYVLLAGLSVMALIRLPVALLPSLAYPSLLVWTAWPEVSPEQVERAVTVPVEQALAGISGVQTVTGRSQLGGSLVRLDFGWNMDLDYRALDVRQKLDRLVGLLPQRAERPLVLRVDPSDRPVLILALGSTHGPEPTPLQLLELKRSAEDVVARRMEQLEGVARVRVTGGHEREIRVDVQPDRMAAYGIDLRSIETALQDANVSLVGGTLQKGPFRYAVEVSGEFRNTAEVAATVVSRRGEPPIRLADVAQVEDVMARRRGQVRFDGREVLLLLVEQRPDANTVRTAAEVRRVLTTLQAELPDVAFDVVVDESVFIEAAIDGVVQALLWGALLAVVILLLFLRRLRLLAAVAVAVPLSLALALVLFDLLGITLNLISLSGLALGVGLLVDNAIVVVESIARLRDKGLDPYRAAAAGAAEVAGAITTSTLTTLAVFLPLSFSEGLAGRLFRDQSLAVACSVGASLLVALTVVPLIASRDRSGAFVDVATQRAPGLRLYGSLLERGLARPRWVIAGGLVFLLGSIGLAMGLPRKVVPEDDEGRLSIALALPPDADLSLVAARSHQVESALSLHPAVEHVLADLGERDDAFLELDPRPPYEGEITVVPKAGAQVEEVLRRIETLPEMRDFTVEARPVRNQLEDLLVTGESDLVIDLMAEKRAYGASAVTALLPALAARPELTNVVRGEPEAAPAYDLQIDRDLVTRLGARVETLDSYIEAAARGREATRLHRVREEIPIVLRTPADSVESLLAEHLPTDAGLLPAGTFLRAESVSLPAVLLRHGQAPVHRLLVDLAPGVGLEEGVAAVEAVVRTGVPASVRTRVGGSNEAFQASLGAVRWSLLLSVLLVYLILAARFENLGQPLVVLSVVPFAIGGAALSLKATGHSWNLMSLTGCVVLVGIAVNDAIVKVDLIHQRRWQGLPLGEAVRRASHDRFRPIVMTTVTTVLGLLPLSWGAGGRIQAPLAVAIVGGLCVATAFTLVVVPVLARSALKNLHSPLVGHSDDLVTQSSPEMCMKTGQQDETS